MRILFLDFDGVLHPGIYEPTPVEDWAWVPVLYRALRQHDDVRVVIHSSWRYEHTLTELRALLGAFVGPLVIDKTAGAGRYASVMRWVEQHDVVSYRILDDAPEEFPAPLPAELILCDPARGIDDPAVLRKLREWLNEERGGEIVS